MTKMQMYKCVCCGKSFTPYEIIRIKKERYELGKYKVFSSEFFINYCEDCYYKVFDKSIEKYINEFKEILC